MQKGDGEKTKMFSLRKKVSFKNKNLVLLQILKALF